MSNKIINYIALSVAFAYLTYGLLLAAAIYNEPSFLRDNPFMWLILTTIFRSIVLYAATKLIIRVSAEAINVYKTKEQ